MALTGNVSEVTDGVFLGIPIGTSGIPGACSEDPRPHASITDPRPASPSLALSIRIFASRQVRAGDKRRQAADLPGMGLRSVQRCRSRRLEYERDECLAGHRI